ncbi:glycine-rich domain-containing protein [Oxalobacteraceae bacterium A2-2]
MNAHAMQAIAALDLEPIKVKLMHQESGEGWTLEHANAVESEYRRFLYLMHEFPTEQTAPLMDVDTFWHYHILDTMKYAADCEAVFGYFLHHFPYIGLRGGDDEAAHQRVGLRMQELYEQTFQEPYRAPGAASAYSGSPGAVGAALAYSGSPGKTAYSGSPGITAQAAYSGSPGLVAYSGSPGKVAYSGSPGKAQTAYSGSPGVTAQTAYSGSPGAAAAVQAAAAIAQARLSGFYSERPRLAAN